MQILYVMYEDKEVYYWSSVGSYKSDTSEGRPQVPFAVTVTYAADMG